MSGVLFCSFFFQLSASDVVYGVNALLEAPVSLMVGLSDVIPLYLC